MALKPIKDLLEFGIINIDKPTGPTSFTVSDQVKRKLKLKKTSHFGTLDPAVTGVLPVALGRACKLTGYFLGHDKEYIGIMHTHKEQSIKELQKIIDKKFIGKIKQTPPIKSAVKRQERIREVFRWELLEESEDKKDFLFIAEVEGGTYIRKLCSDLGEIVEGAHMSELRRIRAGIIKEETSVTLFELDKAIKEYESGNDKPLRKMIFPAEEALKKIMPFIEINKASVKHLHCGKPIFKRDVLTEIPKENVFAVFCKKQFVEIAQKTTEKGEDILAKPLFVFN